MSHSIRSGTSRPWRTPASDRPRTTFSLSATTARRFTRVDSSIRRSVFVSPTMLKVMRMSSATPASMKTSASLSFWQVMPIAPASICIWAMPGILWVLMCGRLARPWRATISWPALMLFSSRSRSMVTAGVSSSSTFIASRMLGGYQIIFLYDKSEAGAVRLEGRFTRRSDRSRVRFSGRGGGRRGRPSPPA